MTPRLAEVGIGHFSLDQSPGLNSPVNLGGADIPLAWLSGTPQPDNE